MPRAGQTMTESVRKVGIGAETGEERMMMEFGFFLKKRRK